MDYRNFNVLKDVNLCGCTWGCAEIVRESALEIDSERKLPCHTGVSNLPQRHAGLMLCQLTYISAPSSWCLLIIPLYVICVHVSDVSACNLHYCDEFALMWFWIQLSTIKFIASIGEIDGCNVISSSSSSSSSGTIPEETPGFGFFF